MKRMHNNNTVQTTLEQSCQDGASFAKMIHTVLRDHARLKKKYIAMLLQDPASLERFHAAFTHNSVNQERNYEWLEIMGDATVNKCVVSYIAQRFPFLRTPEGVKIIARLKIKLVAGKQLASMATRLNFPPHIRYHAPLNAAHLKSLHEDVFEAFIAAIELGIDDHVQPGSGYGVCYRLISSLLDECPISLRYEDLYDAVTRLKETFDYFKQQLWGSIKYEIQKHPEGVSVSAFQYCPQTHRRLLLGRVVGQQPEDLKQQLAQSILDHIHRSQGLIRPIPAYYSEILKLKAQWDKSSP